MASQIKPMQFVRAKKEQLKQPVEENLHGQQVTRYEDEAGKRAREYYETIISTESSTRNERISCTHKTSDHVKKTRKKEKKHYVPERSPMSSGDRSRSRRHDDRTTCSSQKSSKKVNELLRHCQEGNLHEVKRLLKGQEVSLRDSDQFGWNALMCAGYNGHTHLVGYLCRRDLSMLKHKNKQGQSVMELAQMAGHKSVVKLLQHLEQEGDIRTLTSPGGNQLDSRSDMRQPLWCEMCQSEFKDDVRRHEQSTAHLFSCGHEPKPTLYHIPESNRGFQMMLQDGWDREKGLGREGEGHKFPVKTILKRDRQGLGASDSESDVKPRITHFKPYDTDAVKRPKKDDKKQNRTSAGAEKRSRLSEKQKHKAMEIDFRTSFHLQP